MNEKAELSKNSFFFGEIANTTNLILNKKNSLFITSIILNEFSENDIMYYH